MKKRIVTWVAKSKISKSVVFYKKISKFYFAIYEVYDCFLLKNKYSFKKYCQK